MVTNKSTWGCITCSLFLLTAGGAFAQQPAADGCRWSAEAAEREAGLPPGLLVAIGQVESGRSNPMTGRVEPWPWSTNLNGAGHVFATAAEAIAWTTGQIQSGQRSIDVGCFQVNLKYHPDAFVTLQEAFDPASNARYAARFLTALYRQTNDWQLAAAHYHSADPQEGAPYGGRVFALMARAGSPEGPVMTASLGGRFERAAVRLPLFVGIQVIVPAWAEADSAARSTGRVSDQRRSGATIRMASARTALFDRHLPRVYTPSSKS